MKENVGDEGNFHLIDVDKIEVKSLKALKKYVQQKMETYIIPVKALATECIHFHTQCKTLVNSVTLFLNYPKQIDKIKDKLNNLWNHLQLILTLNEQFNYKNIPIGLILKQKRI